jgi:hypothetical protein
LGLDRTLFAQLVGTDRFDPASVSVFGDRGNSRIRIFDQEGKFLAEWKQFGRPSGIFIDRNDIVYVTASQSDAKRNPGFKRGIRIGSAKDGSVHALIPGIGPEPDKESVPEGVAADGMGNVFGTETTANDLKKYVTKQVNNKGSFTLEN